MDQLPKIQELQEDDARFYVPEWLQKVKASDEKATEGMTLDELAAYYEEEAAQLQVESAEDKGC